MLYMFDTSILVAGLVGAHPKHEIAIGWLQKAAKGQIRLAVSAHSLLECYAVLTKLPLSPKISPSIARYLIQENIEKKTKDIVPLTYEDYSDVISRMTQLGLSGGIVYDAIVVKAAEKTRAEGILTFNANDFLRLTPDQKGWIVSLS